VLAFTADRFGRLRRSEYLNFRSNLLAGAALQQSALTAAHAAAGVGLAMKGAVRSEMRKSSTLSGMGTFSPPGNGSPRGMKVAGDHYLAPSNSAMTEVESQSRFELSFSFSHAGGWWAARI
jgi:hypothetical protein